jgi:ATP phosphoribosyltransferase regulatory subunit
VTSRHQAIAPTIQKLFAVRGAAPVEVAVLQPADPFLDIAGEDLRRRIFLTESESGETLCLRPEFTIPVCLDHIASRAGTPRRYSYLGEVFRQRREGGSEFLQAGIEDIGEPDIAGADARSVADAAALLAAVLPGLEFTVTLGDQAVFEAVLAALGLPRGWQKRLARAFGAPDLLEAALADLARPANGPSEDAFYPQLAATGELAPLADGLRQAMEAAGLPTAAGRTPEEIARRMIEKTELSRVRLQDSAFAALKSFLGIRVPLDRSVNTLREFARGAGLSFGPALDLFSARVAAAARHRLPVDGIRYDAAFGRPLDYYTGLVFEIAPPGASRPLAGGGRYDRLLTLLGAPKPIPGVGFSVWLDRIEQLRGGGA